MADENQSFKRYLKKTKITDYQLLQSNSFILGARTYFRNKTNTAKFLNFLEEKIPKLEGYFYPGKPVPQIQPGYYICKPEFSWGGQGVFDLEVTDSLVLSNKLKITSNSVESFFKDVNLNTIYLIEERIYDINDTEQKYGVTDYKFHCFQGMTAPLALIKNRSMNYTIWVNGNMNVVNTGKFNRFPPDHFPSFKDNLIIRTCDRMNALISKIPFTISGIDTFKYLNINSVINLDNPIPIEGFKGFNKFEFIKLREHATALMAKIPLSYCRIDLFNGQNGIIVGELTPIPGGAYRFYPEVDRLLGRHYQEAQNNFVENFKNETFGKVVDHFANEFLFE